MDSEMALLQLLATIFPNVHIVVQYEARYYPKRPAEERLERCYKAYIDQAEFLTFGWSTDYKTMEEVVTDILETIYQFFLKRESAGSVAPPE